MTFFRSHPLFVSLLATALLAGIALGAGMVSLAVANHRARAKLKQRQHELRTLAAAGLLLNEAEAKLANEKVVAIEQQNSELLNRYPKPFKSDRTEEETALMTSTDVFFDLAAFVERMTARGRGCGVELAADERFGFQPYATSGPEAEMIPTVLEHREIIEYLLEHLFAARPRRLLSVDWVPPNHETTPSPWGTRELFADPIRGIRVTSTGRVRIAFVGDSQMAYPFLAAVAGPKSWFVVDGFSAEPAGGGTKGTAKNDTPEPVAGIGQETKFTVVLMDYRLQRSRANRRRSS